MCNKELTIHIRKTSNDIGNDQGKNSETFVSIDEQLDAAFFTKQIKKTAFENIEDYFKEAKMLFACKHPHVAEIQYSSSDEEHIYVLMPLCHNGSIQDKIENSGLSRYLIIKHSLEFLSGLHFIHTKGIYHLDLKPTNILINNSGKAVITDFGLSKYRKENGLASVGGVYNKHRPPEGRHPDFCWEVDQRYDIYQAGLTIYRMCVGNEIFNRSCRPNVSEEDVYRNMKSGTFPDLSMIPKELGDLKKIIAKCTKFDPDDRYDDVMQIIDQFSKLEP
jgi:Serine/threonine protein kinase